MKMKKNMVKPKKKTNVVIILLFLASITLILCWGEVIMISEDNAREIALKKLKEASSEDLDCKTWIGAELDEGFLVYTIHGIPSYWCFPVVKTNRTAGFIRIGYKTGMISSWGTTGIVLENPDDPSKWPKKYRISADDARTKANSIIQKYDDVEVRGPIYVITHEEAWMFVLKKDHKVVTRVFVTEHFVWEEKKIPSPFIVR